MVNRDEDGTHQHGVLESTPHHGPAQGQLQPSGEDSLAHRLVLPACHHFASWSPSIPATIRAMHASLRREWDSPKSIIPRSAVPTAPIPVHTASAVPPGSSTTQREG